MKCQTCEKKMKFEKNLQFNQYKIDGWKCPCGELYYEPEQAQRILLLNKLSQEVVKAKLGKVRSNLILHLPKDIETALNLHQGEEVQLRIAGNKIEIIPC
tara:strand:+ start:14633 stop:14932 length:300 start_codon:yes stop_codon:yes gene_type:complete